MDRTAHLDVSGLHCPLCIGEILDAISDVPGVTQVTVGPMNAGHSLVAVRSATTVTPDLVSAALHAAGFGVKAEGSPLSVNPAEWRDR
jgi:copper chaperone CopZ